MTSEPPPHQPDDARSGADAPDPVTRVLEVGQPEPDEPRGGRSEVQRALGTGYEPRETAAAAKAREKARQLRVAGYFIAVVGLLLGMFDQVEPSSTPTSLRAPAMLAALFLVGQGLLMAIIEGGRAAELARQENTLSEALHRTTEGKSEVVLDSGTGKVVVATQGVNARTVLQQVKLVADVVPQRATAGMALLLMGLSVWLGMALLIVRPTPILGFLSLVAAFLVFTLGWKTLVDPDQPT
jgi:hypothetical protein